MVVIIAGIAGLLGSGPYSHRSLNSPNHDLTVDFEPIARWDTPTQITLHIRRTDTSAVDLHLASNFIEPMGLQGSLPTGVVEAAKGAGILVTVSMSPDQSESLVRLHAKPTQIGPIDLAVQIGDDPPLKWTQYVLP